MSSLRTTGPGVSLRAACAAQVLMLAGPVALAQTPEGAAAQPAEPQGWYRSLMDREHLLGLEPVRRDWGDTGVDVDAYYNAFLGWNARGGAKTAGARRYSHSFDLFVRADTERMGLWPGGTFLLQTKNNVGQNTNPDVGGLSQVIDDADFDEPVYIDQLYYEHHWSAARARLRAGYLDYQTIIDRNTYANSEDLQFMNAALDNNPLIPLKIGFGAALFLEPSERVSLILGTADADSELLHASWDTAFDGENLMAYGELTLETRRTGPRGELSGNYRWGVYYDPRHRRVHGEPGGTTGTVGSWLSLDQLVYRERADESAQGLGLFYRYAWREEESYATSQVHSAGLEYRGALPSRDRDACGLGFYRLEASDDYRRTVAPEFDGEAGLEAYYRIELTPWLAVTPGVQHVENPGGLDGREALVFVLRTRIKL